MKIAVIGGGIAGLGAAWSLCRRHDVTIFEAEPRLGGHAHTVQVAAGAQVAAVDVGFIVYNEHNYPNLVSLFDLLDVATEKSDMSFGVSIDNAKLEYEGSLPGLLAQPTNLFNRRYRRMLRDIFRFFAEAEALLDRPDADDISLGDYLAREGYSDGFVYDHLLPMGAAIWSASYDEMSAFPASSFVRFFRNHALLEPGERPAWRTVTGGSHEYVTRLLDDFRGTVRTGARVDGIARNGESPVVICGGRREIFDAVVMACHADQTLAILADGATPAERHILSQFRYSANKGVLHRDPSLMPRRRRAWASWNFISDGPVAHDGAVFVTYWMNRLQNIAAPENIFVSLNPTRDIDPATVLGEFDYAHPQFDRFALAAQKSLPEIQGRDGIWFCGSYCGNGFHEDGLQAGLEVAAALGAPAPWRDNIVPISPARSAVKPPLLEAAE